MEYRKLGNSDLSVSVIAFGAWAVGGSMWGKADRNDAINAIKSSYNEGVTSIDTAPIYGEGLSEEIVGEAIKGIPRDKIQIMTKFGMRWDLEKGDFAMDSFDNKGNPIKIYKYSGKESVIYECEQSLKRLGVDYIDLYQIHWPESTTPIDETFEAINKLIKDGKIRNAAVSNYSVEQMKEAGITTNIISNQVSYSMLNRKIEAEIIPYCIKNNKSILAYSPMERGLLTGKFKSNHKFGKIDNRAYHKLFVQETIEKVNTFLSKIKPIAEEQGASLGQLILRWTIEQPGITIALAGARDSSQSVQNAKAIDVKISKEQKNFINSELEKLYKLI